MRSLSCSRGVRCMVGDSTSNGQLLLLAAREHAPFAREELSELGKQVEDLLDVSLGGAAVARRLRPSEKTHPQILGNGQVGEDLPPLRHVPDAAGCALFGPEGAQ